VIARLGKETDRSIAEELGTSVSTVRLMRERLAIPALHPGRWTAGEKKLLGRLPDGEVARITGRSRVSVKTKRRLLGLRAVRAPSPAGRST
jgi:hypothetical protein